jgi:mRNA interferase MazF
MPTVTFFKNFLDWFELKPKLDNRNHKPPLIREGEIWWCRFGENIGTEISGKGAEFARPAIIYTKLSKYAFLVIPTTTKLYHKNGTPKANDRFIKFRHGGIEMLACLGQIRVIDYRRIKNKIGDSDQKDYGDVCQKFNQLYSKK